MRIALLALLTLLTACNSGTDTAPTSTEESAPESAEQAEGSAEPAEGEVAEEPEVEAAPDEAPANSVAHQHEAQQQEPPAAPLPLPEGECTGVTPTNPREASSPGGTVRNPLSLGASQPRWVLEDVQPRSCGFGSHYGLSEFDGPVLVVLLSAGCAYCHGQAAKLDELWWEFRADGRDVNIVIVNKTGELERRDALLERTGLPMFQDVAPVDAWGAVDGRKDDFFFYDAEGTLVAYFSSHGEVDTTLATEEGYANIRTGLQFLLGDDVELPLGGHSPHTHHHPR